jgi:alpha-beta hydrolase superfamily lysophospholipase
MTLPAATAKPLIHVETPVLFGRGESLVGILCAPRAPRHASGAAVVLLNSGILHRVGPHRLYVTLARSLAAAGVPSLRFDLGGLGDSPTPLDEHGSVQEIVLRDIQDAISLAATRFGGAIILAGLCSGADNAFYAAVRDRRVRGVALLDPNTHRPRSFYFHHLRRRLTRRRTWRLLLTGRHPVYRHLLPWLRRDGEKPDATVFLAPTELPAREIMEAQLVQLVRRGCRIRAVFTGGLDEQYNHHDQFIRAYPALRKAGELQLEYYEDVGHTFGAPKAQARLVAAMLRWIDGFPAAMNRAE